MSEKLIVEVKKRLNEERKKLREYTRKQQFDIAMIHSVRIDMLYWFLSILEGRRSKK